MYRTITSVICNFVYIVSQPNVKGPVDLLNIELKVTVTEISQLANSDLDELSGNSLEVATTKI